MQMTLVISEYLQHALERVQEQLCRLLLVLNIDKTKLMFFTTSKTARSAPFENTVTRNGWQIELASTFESLLWSTENMYVKIFIKKRVTSLIKGWSVHDVQHL